MDKGETLTFKYEDGAPSTWSWKAGTPSRGKHVARARLTPMEGVAYIYAAMEGLRANPLPYCDGMPDWSAAEGSVANLRPIEDLMAGYWTGREGHEPHNFSEKPQFLQTVSLGFEYVPGFFIPAVRFGLANNGFAIERAYVVLWLNDGETDHFGPYARPGAGERHATWAAESGAFPDQYQLDHIIEVDASATGGDQGYSGWVQMEDGSVFVVNYTDDDSCACIQNPFRLGVPWIRGTFLKPEDLTP